MDEAALKHAFVSLNSALNVTTVNTTSALHEYVLSMFNNLTFETKRLKPKYR